MSESDAGTKQFHRKGNLIVAEFEKENKTTGQTKLYTIKVPIGSDVNQLPETEVEAFLKDPTGTKWNELVKKYNLKSIK